ncbi:MAG: DUF4838 domain-containing protein [Theionarchaea archaeon]|nr:DUF4838 domain-containing protein [Theionarchaea archaeon]
MRIKIYIEGKPDQHLAETLEDLVMCLRRATQAEVTLEGDPKKDTGSGIWVGRTAASSRFSERIDELDYDGYLFWGNGSQLIIGGKTSYGTANGVYSFIHRFLGVRWFAPGPLFEFIPNLESFKLPKIVEFTKPSFAFRMYSGADRDWCRRNLLDIHRPDLPFARFSHNLTNIYPSEKYSETKPYLYALRDGKRITQQASHRGQPCFTHPEAVPVAVEAIRRYFDQNPDAPMYSVAVNDNMDFCECETCAKFEVRRFRGRPIYSDVYFSWVNEIAKQLMESHPEKLLGALAYWGVVLPPSGIERLPPNVVVVLTQDTSQYHDEAYEKEDRVILTEWMGMCENLVKYDYYGLGWLTPRFYPGLAARDLDFLGQSGAIGFYCEAYPFWPIFGPQLYMAARKTWNIARNPAELLEEYYAFFSPVSDEIASFYGVLEESWLLSRPGTWFEGLGDIADELEVMTLEDANRAREHLLRAYEHSTGNCRKRVKFLMDGFELSYQLIRGHHTSSELRVLPVSEASDIEGALPLLIQIQDSIESAERIHREAILPDDLYSEVYFKDQRFYRKFRSWKGILDSTSMTWLERVFDFCGKEISAWNKFMEKLPDAIEKKAEIVPRLLDSIDLMSDPGFEEMEEPPERNAVPGIGGWGLYGENCDCFIDESFVQSGGKSLSFEGRGRNRLTIYLPVQPGGRYAIGAWVYAEPMERRRMPRLDITLLKGAEDQPGTPYSTDLLYRSGEWQRLFSVIEVGEEFDHLGVHLVINNDFDRIWIDDVSVRDVSGEG